MQPLTGVRVLAVEQYGAGPFGTMYLANQGAEVIKIENPRDGGDMSRAVGPYFLGPNDSEFFQSFNANKHSMTIDLQKDEGQQRSEYRMHVVQHGGGGNRQMDDGVENTG